MSASRPDGRRFTVVVAAAGARRVTEAEAFLADRAARGGAVVVAATRDAADELARRVAVGRPATFGLSRFSLAQLAVRVAGPSLAAAGVAPSTVLGFEAVAARVVFDATKAGVLGPLALAAATPGFPRAVARTLADLRSRRVDAADVAALADPAAPVLARLHRDLEAELDAAGVADADRLLTAAARDLSAEGWLASPLVLLDLPLRSLAEQHFVGALVAHASEVIATCPASDRQTLDALESMGGSVVRCDEPSASDLDYLRAHLFDAQPPTVRVASGEVEAFSAPGEGRECVEIARRILREAARGVPFDDIAVLVRAPARYQGLLEHALDRAGVPAWFDRGTARPHPVGRAVLALLACADEGLSARRFAEYLSLGQVPVRPQGAAAAVGAQQDPAAATQEGRPDATGAPEADVPAPRRWERMLVDAAVRRGSPARWKRRLDGLDLELAARQAEAGRDDPDAPQAAALARDRERLRLLASFALPVVEVMAAWPRTALWGEWISHIETLVPQVVGAATPVLAVLADLRPMARVGPVTLREVRQVLADRLRLVEADPPARRYGCVFVGAPERARGRTFRVGFVPGLAERVFPDKLRQDPLLLDTWRVELGRGLDTMADRSARERQLLHLAVGACRERLYVSYPRLDVAESRGRVPSFYALDVIRGITGQVPHHRVFAEEAAAAGASSLAWPAPLEADDAIDTQEHDLAVLRRLLEAEADVAVRGRAQYLLRMNGALRRSVVERWARGGRAWSQYDGLVRVTDGIRDALASHRLTARPYSASALQRYAACPYQFLLSAIHRLHRAETMDAPQRLDPLMRGSLVHRIQAVALRRLRDAGLTPLSVGALPDARGILDDAVTAVAAEFRERLAPPIERVWNDEVAAVARDLRGWLRRVAESAAPWRPEFIEWGFGLPADDTRDSRSLPAALPVYGRYRLRGAIDVVERHVETGALRVTDHKTGKDRTPDGLAVAGGRVLQPLLYAEAAAIGLGQPVQETRLFFCTVDGGYRERPVPLTPQHRRQAVEALEIIDRAIETGFLVPAPEPGTCGRCDFTAVCGPNAEAQWRHKTMLPLGDLAALRSRA